MPPHDLGLCEACTDSICRAWKRAVMFGHLPGSPETSSNHAICSRKHANRNARRVRRRDGSPGRGRLDTGHRRRRRSVPETAQHAPALQEGLSRLAAGPHVPERGRPRGGGVGHGRAAGRPGTAGRSAFRGQAGAHDGGILRPALPRHHGAGNRRRQRPATLHGGRADGPAGGGRRQHGPRLSRGPDDQLRRARPAHVSAGRGRHP